MRSVAQVIPPVRLELLVFDNNGTMLDDLELAYGSVQAIFSILHLHCPTREQYRNEITADFMAFYRRHGVSDDVVGAQLNVIRKLYYQARRGDAVYRADLEQLLKCAQECGLRLAVCSGEMEDVLLECLRGAGLVEYFDFIFGDAWPQKIETLTEILQRCAVLPVAAALVSDTAEDLADARAVGMRTIAFAHPMAYNSAARLEKFRPDYTVQSFKELQRLLPRLTK